MATPIPSAQKQAVVVGKLDALLEAIESHDAWTPPSPHKGLFYVWDFVKRSRYIMAELENIRQDKPVEHREQVPALKNGRTGEVAASESWGDVKTRSLTVDQLIGAPFMLSAMGIPNIDYGATIKARSKAVTEVMF